MRGLADDEQEVKQRRPSEEDALERCGRRSQMGNGFPLINCTCLASGG